jgi:hypothetical protein
MGNGKPRCGSRLGGWLVRGEAGLKSTTVGVQFNECGCQVVGDAEVDGEVDITEVVGELRIIFK